MGLSAPAPTEGGSISHGLGSSGSSSARCGRSTPHASDPSTSLQDNDTAHLVADMEVLREHLGIERWIVNGVSWGSTLALAYAVTHPDRVLGVVLFAVTTTSRSEVDWITEGVGTVFPAAWDRFAAHAEQAGIGYQRGQGRIIDAYAHLMESDDPRVRNAASREWALWEDTHISIGAGGFRRDPPVGRRGVPHRVLPADRPLLVPRRLRPAPILDQGERLAGIPATLIHGRRDISSPAITPWRLHRAWPGSQLILDEGDGHGGATMVEHWRAANEALVAQHSRPL
nr:alpha/beta fold hydrolase [Kytococcus sedentarius]